MKYSEQAGGNGGVGADDIARFERIFSRGSAELTPDTIPIFRDTIGLGNYAQVLLDAMPEEEVDKGLAGLVAERDKIVDGVAAGILPELIPRVIRRWHAIAPEDRVRSGGGQAGLLNTLYEGRERLRERLGEVTGVESSDSFVEEVVNDTVDAVESWLTSTGRYVMRPRRIKATILSQEEVQTTYAAMQDLPADSEEWKQERGKLLESLYRLSKFIARERFLKTGRLASGVEVKDLAHQAVSYFVGRIDAYDPAKGPSFANWCTNFLDHYYARTQVALTNPIAVPQPHAAALRTLNIDTQLEVADVLTGRRDDQPRLRLAWLADGRNIVSLDDEEAMRIHTGQTETDQTGVQESLPYQELLTDYHRLGEGGGVWNTELWAGHRTADQLTDPEHYADMKALQAAVRDIIDERLDEREAWAIGLRFGLEDGQTRTFQEVGEYLGVTRERVRQIENKALSKLRYRDSELRLFVEQGAGHDWSLENYVRRPVADPLPDYAVYEATHAHISPQASTPTSTPPTPRSRFRRALPSSEWDW